MKDVVELVHRAIRAAAQNELPDRIQSHHSFLEDLGFDSLSLSVLTLELEALLGRPVLLNRWVERASSPSKLTVESLCEYLEGVAA
jgi:acyl carrier protein